MQQPPLLPEELLAHERSLARVQMLARRNGLSIVIVATASALLLASNHDHTGALAGLFAAGAGGMEMHGASLLAAGEKRGMSWLIRAELLLLAILFGYCAARWLNPNYEEMRLAFRTSLEFPGMKERWAEAQRLGFTEDSYIKFLSRLGVIAFAVATLVYQGGMALYYAIKRKSVELALSETEEE